MRQEFLDDLIDSEAEINLRKFVWVGYIKETEKYYVSRPLTTRHLLRLEYPSIFTQKKHCDFVMEISEGDELIYYSESSMSNLFVKIEDGIFVGQGIFNTHPLEAYFNAKDFIKMEKQE